MLDFNDTPPPVPRDLDAEREAIRAELLARVESVLAALLPAGRKRGGKFLIGDVLGSPGDSLEIVLDGEKAGLWTDRATGDGGDIFALIAAHLGIGVLHDFRACSTQPPICSVVPEKSLCARPARRMHPSTNSAPPPPSGTTSTRQAI
ncbi:hypothetical protein P4129_27025 [Pseudomonas aeruginosa]|nr:hypothetical protein [Pseudomonas aeruginosa]